ncbi:MAG: hypothetical protein RL150_212 [Candidatus Parcubacteria bacterium]|jgi:cell shape-determining protein MreC
MFKKTLVILLVLSFSLPASVSAQVAQDSDRTALLQVISSLMAQIELLQKEVADLKKTKTDIKKEVTEVLKEEKKKEEKEARKKKREEEKQAERVQGAESLRREIKNLCNSARPKTDLAKSIVDNKCRRLQKEYKNKTGIELDINPRTVFEA